MAFDFDPTAEDIKVFLDEAEEQLQLMEEDFVKLEKEVDNPELLKEIFRAAHTLKGSSATLGHKKMAEVTHAMENVLDKLRKGKLVLTTSVVDTFFACLDVLKAFKEEIATGQESAVETGDIIARLSAIELTTSSSGQAPAQQVAAALAEPAAPATAQQHPPLSPAEEAQLQAGREKGLTAYWMDATLEKNAAMPAVRAFQCLLSLGDIGEVVRSWPSQEDVEEDRVTDELKAVFLTAQSPDQVKAVLVSVPELTVLQLAPLVAQEERPETAGEEVEDADSSPVAAPEKGEGRVQEAKVAARGARTVRVDVDVLDNLMNLVGELVIDRTRLLQVLTHIEVAREEDEMAQVMAGAVAHIGRVTADLQTEIMRARMIPVDNLFKKFPRMVRDVAQRAGKEINFIVRGEETELDRSVIEEIGDPLMHTLRNAVDHGVEPPLERLRVGKPPEGTVILEAAHEENHIIISVRDDGRGIDPVKIRASAVRKGILTEDAARRLSDQEAIELIWAPGFSTAEKVSDISGRGVGLDVVHKNLEKLNGTVDIRSEIGKGTEFRIKLPLTLAIIRALQVQVMGTVYAIPLSSVIETDRIPRSKIQTMRQKEVIVQRGEVIPLLRLTEAFRIDTGPDFKEPDELFVVIVSVFSRQIGIVVDGLIGEGDVVIKPLGKFIGDVPGVSGATILGDGDVAIILDISSLINTVIYERERMEASAMPS